MQDMWESFADKATRFFKTDVRYLVRSGFWLTMSQVFSSAASFAISLAFANLLSKDAFGMYKYVLSIVSILSIASLSGIDTALSQAIARDHDGSFAPGLKRKILWGFMGGTIGLVVSGYYFVQANWLLAASLIVASLVMPFMNGFDLYNAVLSGKRQFKRYSFYNAWSQIANMVMLVATIYFTKNAIAIVSVYFIGNALINLYFLRRTLKANPLNDHVDPETLSYGAHLSAMDIINTVAGQLDKILVFHYFGAAELAIYTVAIAPTEQIKALLKGINFIAMPRFAMRDKEDMKANMGSKVLALIAFSAAIIAAYIFAAPFLFHVFFPAYADSVAYSQVVAISIVAFIAGSLLQTALKAQASTRQLYKFNIYTNVVSVALLAVGIGWFGIWGAIWARVIGRLFLFALSYFLVKRM